MSKLLIYGSGGFAREVAWLAQSCGYEVMAFVDDNPERQGKRVNEIQVISFNEAQLFAKRLPIVLAVGSSQLRERLYEKAKKAGFRFQSLIHPRAEMSELIEIGEGTVIAAGSILTVNIKLGKQVQINLDCTIGHDVVVEDFATLAPGVHVSGWVHIGPRAYIGTGAVIINGSENNPIYIGEDAVVGAGAVVTKSVPSRTTVVGVPARPLEKEGKKSS
jgi:sugar O-acyltransferase (sialic acid O-acetyltransferase NeuD family)